MASNYNQRSGSSGSNGHRKTSSGSNASGKPGLNRSKAGYYASTSKKNNNAESFESRAARSRLTSLPHVHPDDKLLMSSSNRHFTAHNGGSAHRSSSTNQMHTSPKGASRQHGSQGHRPKLEQPSSSRFVFAQSGDRKRQSGASSSNRHRQSIDQSSLGRTIGDIKAQKAIPSFFDVNRHIIVKLGFGLAIVALIALIGFILYHAPILKVENVTVSGNSCLSSETVLELADVSDSATLLNPGTVGIERRLKSNAWIESVSIHRSFPSTIEIVVNERPITAVVVVPVTAQTLASTKWAMSSEGIWLDQIVALPQETTVTNADGSTTVTQLDGSTQTTAPDGTITTTPPTTPQASGTATDTAVTTNATAVTGGTSVTNNGKTVAVTDEERHIAEVAATRPVITDTAITAAPVAGETCTDAGVLNALAIISSSIDEFSSRVSQVSAPTEEKTVALLDNGVTVAFGSAADLQSKVRVVEQLLAEHEGNISYINVRVVDRPSWRGLV